MSKKIAKPGADHDLNCLTIKELELLALERMDKQTRDYYNEGADDNSTLQENQSAYNKYRIKPRVLRDVTVVDTSVNIFGQRSASPFGVAPSAMQGLAHIDAELGTARACRAWSTPMGLSSFATSSLEDVREASGENVNVLQLYLFEDKEHSRKLIERAKKAGYKAVFLTVDTPYLGRRNSEIRSQFQLPAHLKIANFHGDPNDEEEVEVESEEDHHKLSHPEGHREKIKIKRRKVSAQGYHDGRVRVPPTGPITFHSHAPNPTLSWEHDIPWLSQVAAPMQVWIKGIAAPEDALLAIHHKCDGIVVSNHGGRQLNGALATLDALPDIVDAVKASDRKIPIHIDGGIRHGTDIFKALALGADYCWVGRPALWGLAYKGEAGVSLMLKLLSDEFKLAMALAGVTKVSDIDKQYLMKRDRDGFVSKV